MYLSTERVAPYPTPVRPDFTGLKKRVAQSGRKLLTTCLGREFMALTARRKLHALYCIASLMAPITLWSETHPWLVLPLVANLANAVRAANKIVNERSYNS